MQFVQQLVQKYDPATVFVSAATVVVCVELAVMRVFLPASASAMNEASLVEQICTTENIEQSAQDVQDWSVSANSATEKFLQDPAGWQEELVEMHAFGSAPVIVEHESIAQVASRAQFIAAANYAADNLSLQSVMSGRTMLANINGNIYREGDTIPMRGGEIQLDLIELGTTFAVFQLAEGDENGDTTRTIFLTSETTLAHGNRTP
ncbi:MAG: hypothetical protein ACI9JK_000725 [Phycisphaerales bacterium]